MARFSVQLTENYKDKAWPLKDVLGWTFSRICRDKVCDCHMTYKWSHDPSLTNRKLFLAECQVLLWPEIQPKHAMNHQDHLYLLLPLRIYGYQYIYMHIYRIIAVHDQNAKLLPPPPPWPLYKYISKFSVLNHGDKFIILLSQGFKK